MYFEMILLFSGAVCTYGYTLTCQYNYGCFESGEALLSMTCDGDDEVFHIDYKRKTVEWQWPTRIQSAVSGLHIPFLPTFEVAKRFKGECPTVMDTSYYLNDEDKGPEAKEAPDTMIYPKDEVKGGTENTLICFVNRFYPPSIKVKWTKNGAVVAVEDRVLSYYPNYPDATYRHISTLTFTPQEGDVYACTVEHEALQEPQTRRWEFPEAFIESSSAPAVFCGVGVTLGLLGIATGTFLLVKAKRLH